MLFRSEKKVRSALAAKNSGEAKSSLAEAIQMIARAAQRGVIKRETASRHISRLTLAVQRLK